jgi:hypothetical protein
VLLGPGPDAALLLLQLRRHVRLCTRQRRQPGLPGELGRCCRVLRLGLGLGLGLVLRLGLGLLLRWCLVMGGLRVLGVLQRGGLGGCGAGGQQVGQVGWGAA